MEQSLLHLLTGVLQEGPVLREPLQHTVLKTTPPPNTEFVGLLEKAGAVSLSHNVESQDRHLQETVGEELADANIAELVSEQSPLINGILSLQQPPITHAPTQESFIAAISVTRDVAQQLNILESDNITIIADIEDTSLHILPQDEVVLSKDAVHHTIIEHEASVYHSERIDIKQQEQTQTYIEEELRNIVDVDGEEILAAPVAQAPLIDVNSQIHTHKASEHVSITPLLSVQDTSSRQLTPPQRSIIHIESLPSLGNAVSVEQMPTLQGQHTHIAQTALANIQHDTAQEVPLQPLQDFSAVVQQDRTSSPTYTQPVRFVVPTAEMLHLSPPRQTTVHVSQALKDGQRNISIRLHPEEMGRVDIRMEISNEQVSMKVITETREAYDMLRADRMQLEALLKESGFNADSNSFEFSHQQQQQEGEEGADTHAADRSAVEAESEKTQELQQDSETGILLATQGLNIKV